MAKVIKVENLSKVYQLGDFGTGTMSRDLERFWARMRGKEDPFLKIGEVNDRTTKGESDIVWSLRDLNFEIEQGDAVGIIGRNGAGKSTLLKILSRVTSPTTGSVKVKGRIASLLEVGTGFHPELSEIKRKFDEIVDFSGVERYIDTPVKRYSSGMYVRLAFAVAAHLESEILIVDEVLAVGDAEFQKKCLGKMGDVSKGEGRTILFVSHQLNSVKSLCNNCILLDNGSIKDYRSTAKVVADYLYNGKDGRSAWSRIDNKFDRQQFSPLKFAIVDVEKNETSMLANNNPIGVYIEGEVEKVESDFCIGFAVYDVLNNLLFWSLNTDKEDKDWIKMTTGNNKLIGWIKPHFLNEGEYRVELISAIHFKEWFCKPEYNSPSVYFSIKGGLSKSAHWSEARPGILAPINNFQKI